MPLIVADRVKETTATTGTGTVNLGGAASGFIGFVAGIGNGNTCYYSIVGATEWEVGIGTVTDAATDTLSRTTVLSSSNANALVNFSAGTKDVFVTMPASYFLTVFPTVNNEVPAGLVNGSNKIFTTVKEYITSSTSVFLNGLKQKLSISYTETGANQITFDDAPITGDQIIIDYKY